MSFKYINFNTLFRQLLLLDYSTPVNALLGSPMVLLWYFNLCRL